MVGGNELEAKILENGLCNGLRADIKIKLGQCQGKWKVWNRIKRHFRKGSIQLEAKGKLQEREIVAFLRIILKGLAAWPSG